MKTGAIISLAWPDTLVYTADAWYDFLMKLIGVNKNGYYKVGHAACVLIEFDTRRVEYFDFGRYHTPQGFGRVRDQESDPDVRLNFKPEITEDFQIANLEDLLLELSGLKATHGDGKLVASFYNNINFVKTYQKAKSLQSQGAIPYGPFVHNGTNCSRFVATLARAGSRSVFKQLAFQVPYVVSHSPVSNVKIANSLKSYFVVDEELVQLQSSRISTLYNFSHYGKR